MRCMNLSIWEIENAGSWVRQRVTSELFGNRCGGVQECEAIMYGCNR